MIVDGADVFAIFDVMFRLMFFAAMPPLMPRAALRDGAVMMIRLRVIYVTMFTRRLPAPHCAALHAALRHRYMRRCVAATRCRQQIHSIRYAAISPRYAIPAP